MPRQKQRSPVASFDALLLELFRRAATEPVRVVLPSPAAAHRLRFRLHSLREAMRREKHPALALAEAVTIRIVQSIDSAVLLASPSDAEFADVLGVAGVKADAAAQAASEKIEPMDEFLSKLVNREKED